MEIKFETRRDYLLHLMKIWYEYVSLDHHKSRDLIYQVIANFDVSKERLTYQVYRPAYIGTSIDYEEFFTEDEAVHYLVETLTDDFRGAIELLEREIANVENPDPDSWGGRGGSVQEWKDLLERMRAEID